MTATRQAASVLRSKGRSVVVGTPKLDDMSNFWVMGDRGVAQVLNIQTFSVLGMGCWNHPEYENTRDALMDEARGLLDAAGIPHTPGIAPDQLFLSGYVSEVK